MFEIKKAEFIMGFAAGSSFPPEKRCEIAVVGRSNAGKSSLINTLCRNHKLARTSAAPGKTRQCNYFLINGDFYLVDLPGYGFAKAPRGEKESWGELMDRYLSSGRVNHLFLLLDIRHPPTDEDRQMLAYVVYYGIPFTIIATKADKLAKTKVKPAANLNAKLCGAPPYAIPFSSETGAGREELLSRIEAILADRNGEAEGSGQ